MKLHLALLATTAAVALAGAFTPAAAEPPAPMSEQELSTSRGGILSADGLAFQFGAVVKTFEDGALALQTQVTWTPQGVVSTQELGAGVMQVVPPAGLAEQTGLTYYSQNGASFAHDVASGQIVNVLLNTDSNRNFTQQTDVTIQLPGFEGVQGDIQHSLMGLRLADDMDIGAIGALH